LSSSRLSNRRKFLKNDRLNMNLKMFKSFIGRVYSYQILVFLRKMKRNIKLSSKILENC